MTDKIHPPLVSYYMTAVENRAKSIEKGHFVAEDVPYVRVQQRGSRDTTERPYTDWIALQKQHANEGRIPQDWIDKFEIGFERWIKGEQMPEDGTPIKSWPVATPAQVKMLIGLNIMTVEQLAVINTEVISRLGMGGLTLKQQANDYLNAASSTGKVVEELRAANTRADAAEARVTALEEQMSKLMALVDPAKIPVSEGAEKPAQQFQL